MAANTRSGRGRRLPVVSEQPSPTNSNGSKRRRSPSPVTSGRGRGRGRGRLSSPTPNQHRPGKEVPVRNRQPLQKQEEEEPVRNQHRLQEEEEEEEEPVESLIESLQKEYLVALVMEALSEYPDLIEKVRKLAEVDPAQREIFVSHMGGKRTTTPFTSETLTSYFGKYGEIEKCMSSISDMSGITEATAYIVFKQRKAAWEAVKQHHQKIGDNSIYCVLLSLWRHDNPSRWVPNFSQRSSYQYQFQLPEIYSAASAGQEEEEEPLEKLLEAFGKENLVGLIKEAMLKIPNLMESIYNYANMDPALRHIFACSFRLEFSVNVTILTSVFEKYGELEDCMFRDEGASILFKHRNSAWKAVKQRSVKVGDQITWCMRPGTSPTWVSMGEGLMMKKNEKI